MRLPSIQPKQRQLSIACGAVTLGMPEPTFAIRIHRPGALSCSASSQASKSSCVANAWTGRSSPPGTDRRLRAPRAAEDRAAVQRGPGLEDVEAEVAEQLAQRRGREEP